MSSTSSVLIAGVTGALGAGAAAGPDDSSAGRLQPIRQQIERRSAIAGRVMDPSLGPDRKNSNGGGDRGPFPAHGGAKWPFRLAGRGAPRWPRAASGPDRWPAAATEAAPAPSAKPR